MTVLKYVVLSKIISVQIWTNNENVIIKTAPIARKFIGQKKDKFINWLVSKNAEPELHYLGQEIWQR